MPPVEVPVAPPVAVPVVPVVFVPVEPVAALVLPVLISLLFTLLGCRFSLAPGATAPASAAALAAPLLLDAASAAPLARVRVVVAQ